MNPKRPHRARRHFLRATGLSLSLPLLESNGEESSPSPAEPHEVPAKAKRLICVGSNLGLYRPALYPTKTGRDYETTALTQPLQTHRDDVTLFSGLDHRAGNGHGNWDNFLCGKRVGDVSMDQIAAEKIGQATRFESIQLCAGGLAQQKMVYSRAGVPLPMINRPSVVYGKLFASADDRQRTEYLLRSGRSSLDIVREQAKDLSRQVSSSDQQKLSEYFTSLRELEQRMGKQLDHLADDAADVDYELPPYDPVAPTLMLECEQIMYDIMALALQTDSTRVATLHIAGLGQVFTLEGETLRAGYHALSHHGNDPDLIRDLIRVEVEHMKCLSNFLSQLKEKTDEHGQPLLDTTVVMFGTGMGDASRHSNSDLPTIVAGGGFQHGEHRAFNSAKGDHLLGDVFINILRQLGVPADSFSDAKDGLDDWA